MHFEKRTFGYTKKKELVSLYRLENTSGAYLELSDYGCRVRSICVPDKNGILRDVVLGYADLAGYEADTTGQGAVVGRHANRIAKAQFTLNGKTYHLEKNDGNNHLHGGKHNFAFRVFQADHVDNKIIFTRTFPDGEGGYPGNLDVKVIYEWTEDNRLFLTYQALSDADTVFNITNHSYFNLDGFESDSILNHELQIFADRLTEADDESLSTGVILPVEGTPFDFRHFKTIGRDIASDHYLIRYGHGFDHNYVLDGDGFRKVAILQSPDSGIRMTCYTDEPGMQLYTGNYLSGDDPDKYGRTLKARRGVCLETQHFPNSMEHPEFPSVVIKANEPYISKTCYSFDTI